MTHSTCFQCISSSGQSAYTKPEAEAGLYQLFTRSCNIQCKDRIMTMMCSTSDATGVTLNLTESVRLNFQ